MERPSNQFPPAASPPDISTKLWACISLRCRPFLYPRTKHLRPHRIAKRKKTKVRRALQRHILFASAAPKHKRHTNNDDQNKFFTRQASFKIGLNIVNQKHETTLSTNHVLKKRPRQAYLNLTYKRVKKE